VVIIGTLAVTAVASQLASRNKSEEEIESRTMSMPSTEDD
jgi:hypothetical protein